MRITVAICTWNRATLLRQTLEGLERMAVPADLAWELLVVDNGSTDRTSEILRSFRPRFSFRSVVEPSSGVSFARNRAIAECRADYLLFTDDDVQVDERWLAEFVEATSRYPEAGGFGGTIEPWFPFEPDPTLVQAFPALRLGFCGTPWKDPEGIMPPGRHAIGANVGYRRSALTGLEFRTDLGPQANNTIGGEEIALQEAIRGAGYPIVWVPSMTVKHFVEPKRMTLDYLLKFAEDAGRKEIRLKGIPPGRRVAGVPRWLIGKAVDAQTAALSSRLRGRRIEALGHLRRRHEFTGMIKECWARRGQPEAVGHAGALGWD